LHRKLGRGVRRLVDAWRSRPTSVTIPLVMIPIGIAALILGENVSRAFTNIGGGTIIRIMGAAMLLGGVCVLVSVLRSDPLQEMIGLSLIVFGAAIYGCGVILGLRVQGIVAGMGYLAIATGFLGRVLMLVREARARQRSEEK